MARLTLTSPSWPRSGRWRTPCPAVWCWLSPSPSCTPLSVWTPAWCNNSQPPPTKPHRLHHRTSADTSLQKHFNTSSQTSHTCTRYSSSNPENECGLKKRALHLKTFKHVNKWFWNDQNMLIIQNYTWIWLINYFIYKHKKQVNTLFWNDQNMLMIQNYTWIWLDFDWILILIVLFRNNHKKKEF